MADDDVLLRVEDLKMYFPIRKGVLIDRCIGYVKAVDGISFDVRRGETLGLVGESGCGKSTTGYAILRLDEPTGGRVLFEGMNLKELNKGQMRKLRTKMQMIFQDPYSSLNPRMTVAEIVGDPLLIHTTLTQAERRDRVHELLNLVGLNVAFARRYPHEFSGGQRQRVGVAKALALNPGFVVCDEPISALDVSVQAQIINLLEDLQEQFGLTYLFISHDLGVVRHIADRVAVMYLGQLMELAERDDLYASPLHPYTQALLSAVTIPDSGIERKRKRIILKGEVPSPSNPPKGCVFSTRCRFVQSLCIEDVPEFRELRAGHRVSCHFAETGLN